MSHHIRTAVAIITLMLAPVEVAHAQAAQTPRAAQDFLGQVLPGAIRILPDYDPFSYDCDTVTCPGPATLEGFRRRVRTHTIERLTPQSNPCVTLILSGRAAVPLRMPGEYRGGGWDETRPAISGSQDGIEWAKVQVVSTAGSSVTLDTGAQGDFRRLQFNFSGEGMAARVGYAMEFLRLQCDPTARTGF